MSSRSNDIRIVSCIDEYNALREKHSVGNDLTRILFEYGIKEGVVNPAVKEFEKDNKGSFDKVDSTEVQSYFDRATPKSWFYRLIVATTTSVNTPLSLDLLALAFLEIDSLGRYSGTTKSQCKYIITASVSIISNLLEDQLWSINDIFDFSQRLARLNAPKETIKEIVSQLLEIEKDFLFSKDKHAQSLKALIKNLLQLYTVESSYQSESESLETADSKEEKNQTSLPNLINNIDEQIIQVKIKTQLSTNQEVQLDTIKALALKLLNLTELLRRETCSTRLTSSLAKLEFSHHPEVQKYISDKTSADFIDALNIFKRYKNGELTKEKFLKKMYKLGGTYYTDTMKTLTKAMNIMAGLTHSKFFRNLIWKFQPAVFLILASSEALKKARLVAYVSQNAIPIGKYGKFLLVNIRDEHGRPSLNNALLCCEDNARSVSLRKATASEIAQVTESEPRINQLLTGNDLASKDLIELEDNLNEDFVVHACTEFNGQYYPDDFLKEVRDAMNHELKLQNIIEFISQLREITKTEQMKNGDDEPKYSSDFIDEFKSVLIGTWVEPTYHFDTNGASSTSPWDNKVIQKIGKGVLGYIKEKAEKTKLRPITYRMDPMILALTQDLPKNPVNTETTLTKKNKANEINESAEDQFLLSELSSFIELLSNEYTHSKKILGNVNQIIKTIVDIQIQLLNGKYVGKDITADIMPLFDNLVDMGTDALKTQLQSEVSKFKKAHTATKDTGEQSAQQIFSLLRSMLEITRKQGATYVLSMSSLRRASAYLIQQLHQFSEVQPGKLGSKCEEMIQHINQQFGTPDKLSESQLMLRQAHQDFAHYAERIKQIDSIRNELHEHLKKAKKPKYKSLDKDIKILNTLLINAGFVQFQEDISIEPLAPIAFLKASSKEKLKEKQRNNLISVIEKLLEQTKVLINRYNEHQQHILKILPDLILTTGKIGTWNTELPKWYKNFVQTTLKKDADVNKDKTFIKFSEALIKAFSKKERGASSYTMILDFLTATHSAPSDITAKKELLLKPVNVENEENRKILLKDLPSKLLAEKNLPFNEHNHSTDETNNSTDTKSTSMPDHKSKQSLQENNAAMLFRTPRNSVQSDSSSNNDPDDVPSNSDTASHSISS